MKDCLPSVVDVFTVSADRIRKPPESKNVVLIFCRFHSSFPAPVRRLILIWKKKEEKEDKISTRNLNRPENHPILDWIMNRTILAMLIAKTKTSAATTLLNKLFKKDCETAILSTCFVCTVSTFSNSILIDGQMPLIPSAIPYSHHERSVVHLLLQPTTKHGSTFG